MNNKYIKAVCVFAIAFSLPILLDCILEATPHPVERVGCVFMLLMYAVAALGIGLLCGEDDK